LNLQLLDEKGSSFGVQTHKAALGMLHGNFLQVHVDNLAALEIFVEEGNHRES